MMPSSPMAERKNMEFDRPGGYAMPKGATAVQREAAQAMTEADVRLYGDQVKTYRPKKVRRLEPAHSAKGPDTRVYVGDCRDVLASLPDRGNVDLIFADPPFNWDVPYDEWHDGMPRPEYERFTFDWLDGCIGALAPSGSLWVNIPDDTAAEAIVHLKRRGLKMINWCIWHFRFGQHRASSFILSKVHVLYFVKDPAQRIWNPNDILEPSDRASIYADPRTMAKEHNKGMRVPMDVWYGQYWGRIQGNNKERRHQHHNQIPEAYLERVIRACSNPGDLVLDPFLGSGTTSTVARALGRRSIGIEYSPVGAESAWQRILDGPVRIGKALGQSTAIFKPRGKPASAGAPA
ncbi:MAG: DNA-methyltransferase [Planctomycetota bacterium]